MASPKNKKYSNHRKKTRQGNSTRTIYGKPGPHGGNKGYKKKYRGQGKKR